MDLPLALREGYALWSVYPPIREQNIVYKNGPVLGHETLAK